MKTLNKLGYIIDVSFHLSFKVAYTPGFKCWHFEYSSVLLLHFHIFEFCNEPFIISHTMYILSKQMLYKCQGIYNLRLTCFCTWFKFDMLPVLKKKTLSLLRYRSLFYRITCKSVPKVGKRGMTEGKTTLQERWTSVSTVT